MNRVNRPHMGIFYPGKVGIPDPILPKREKRTAGEHGIMKTRTTIGEGIPGASNNPYLQSARRFTRYRHERREGSGYPFGWKGGEIPVEGRMMYLSDGKDQRRG